jgi:hypothetical protein
MTTYIQTGGDAGENQGFDVYSNFAYPTGVTGGVDTTPDTSFWGGFTDTISGAGDWITNTASSLLGGYNTYNQIKLGNEVQKIRNEAILQTVRNAPTAAQATLPDMAQMQNGEDISAATRAMIIAGQAGTAVKNNWMLIAAGIGAIYFMRR